MAGARRTQHDATATKQSAADEHSEGQSSTSGRGWHGDPDGHAEAGRKGGQKVSRNREHMAAIGRKGGEAVSQDRRHMAEIGRKGGQARTERTDTEKTA